MYRNMQTEIIIKANILTAWYKGTENTFGKMAVAIRAISNKAIEMATVYGDNKKDRCIKVIT